MPPVISYLGWPAIEYARVDLPEPFGPMMAWVSPDLHGQVDAGQDRLELAVGQLDRHLQVADLQGAHYRVTPLLGVRLT